jgi:hypothetical protein
MGRYRKARRRKMNSRKLKIWASSNGHSILNASVIPLKETSLS